MNEIEEKDPIIWRCVSWKSYAGGMMGYYRREYMYDDLVSIDRLSAFVGELEKMGIENVKLERLGPLSFVLRKNLHSSPRPGTKRLSLSLNKNHRLEDFT